MLKEFKEFATKGNIMDMAIGVIIGGAYRYKYRKCNNQKINNSSNKRTIFNRRATYCKN